MALPQHRHDPISFIFIPSGVVLLPANQIRLGAAPLKGMITKNWHASKIIVCGLC
jgi:hypothetical protein